MKLEGGRHKFAVVGGGVAVAADGRAGSWSQSLLAHTHAAGVSPCLAIFNSITSSPINDAVSLALVLHASLQTSVPLGLTAKHIATK